MENNQNNKNNSDKNAQQGGYKSLLGAQRVMSGFGKKVPKDCESIEYVNKIASAMQAWTECGDSEKRCYILIAVGENGSGDSDARSLSFSQGGSHDALVSAVMNVLDNDPGFRRIIGKAIAEMAFLAKEQSNNK